MTDFDIEDFKLSRLLGVSTEELESAGFDIVDVYFFEGKDTQHFLNLAKIEMRYGLKPIKDMFRNIESVMERDDTSLNNKLSIICKENPLTTNLGLGYSNGGSSSHGPERKALKKFVEFIVKLNVEEDHYKKVSLFEYSLKGIAADGISDLFANMNRDFILRCSWEANRRLWNKMNDENSRLTKNLKIEFSDNPKDPFVLYNKCKRYLIDPSLTNSNYVNDGQFAKELATFGSSKNLKLIKNETLRDQLQRLSQLATENLFDINKWKQFIDLFDELNSGKDEIKKEFKYIRKLSNKLFSYDLGERPNTIDILRNLNIDSTKESGDEKKYSELIRVSYTLLDVEFTSEVKVSTARTSGQIDFHLTDLNILQELKRVNRSKGEAENKSKWYIKQIERMISQIDLYSKDDKYLDSHLEIIAFIPRESETIILNYLKSKKRIGRDIRFILFKYDFLTSSKLSVAFKDEDKSSDKYEENKKYNELLEENNKCIEFLWTSNEDQK